MERNTTRHTDITVNCMLIQSLKAITFCKTKYLLSVGDDTVHFNGKNLYRNYKRNKPQWFMQEGKITVEELESFHLNLSSHLYKNN